MKNLRTNQTNLNANPNTNSQFRFIATREGATQEGNIVAGLVLLPGFRFHSWNLSLLFMHISDVGVEDEEVTWEIWLLIWMEDMCLLPSSSVKRVLSPQRQQRPQKFAKCKPLLSWVRLFAAPAEWFKGTGRWGRGRYYRILILSLHAPSVGRDYK